MSYNINLGIGRVQNTTAKNIFLRDQSLFEFCRSTVGMKYDSISDYLTNTIRSQRRESILAKL